MGLDAAVRRTGKRGFGFHCSWGVCVDLGKAFYSAAAPGGREKLRLRTAGSLGAVNPLLVSNLSCCSDIIIGSEFAVWGVGRVRL